jgi:putative membrane protein
MAMYKRLEDLSAEKFDDAFSKDMVKDHEEDIEKYEKEAASGSSLADFAKQTVPVLKKHLEMAKALKAH